MIKDKFIEAVDQLQKKLRDTQSENIITAANLIADCALNDGCVHLYDTGHIIDSEIFNRAGGYEMMRRFKFELTVTGTARKRSYMEKDESMEGLAKFALRKGDVQKGDVMIIGSVSGKTPNVIDIALACKEMGVKVITISSITYSSQLESMHSSKKHLYEIGDVNIDNCAPYGDAMIEDDRLDSTFIPASGLSAAYLMWMMCADLAEILLERGVKPGILRSVNKPGNHEYNLELAELYQKRSY